MPMLAINPAAFRSLLSPLVEPATKSFPVCNGGGGRRPSYGALRSSRLAAMAADFFRQNADGRHCPGACLPPCIPPWFGHRFGAIHAPCGNSLFCFGRAALRVTVSLQILFRKYTEKISPEPP
jgi:hypothetical protein